MNRFRDPVLVAQFVASALGVLVAFKMGVNDEQAALWLAGFNAVVAAVGAFVVKPVSPSVIGGAFNALAALVGGYGFELPPEQLAALNGLIAMAVVFFFVRPNSTLAADPQPGQGVPLAVASRTKAGVPPL